MKMLMLIVLLGGLLALGAWQMGYFPTTKPKEEPKQEAKAEEKSEDNKQEKQISEADKAKLEADAKAKAEATAKIDAEKNKADTEARLADLSQQYEDKKTSFIAMSKEKKVYETAMKDLESTSAELINAIPEIQNTAKDIISQMKSLESQIAQQSKDLTKAKNNLTQAESFIGGQRDKKDRIGWKYVGSERVYSMSEYDSRNRKKPVKFLYKEDTRKQDGVDLATGDHQQEKQELTDLKNKFADLKKQLNETKAKYRAELQQKIDQLSRDMRNAKEEGKKLDAEIDKLKS